VVEYWVVILGGWVMSEMLSLLLLLWLFSRCLNSEFMV